MPTVSVVVPNYNHAHFLRRRIDTILGQTFQDFELILLDDRSTDDSRSIFREYASDLRIRLDFNDVNSGSPFKQWNKGVRLAQGKYVWIAESDDYADSRLLERLVSALDADPKVTFAYCRSHRVLTDDRLHGYGDHYLARFSERQWLADFSMDGHEMCQKYVSRTNPVPNASSVIFRKEIYERIGGADENLRLCGDWKLWTSMALEGNVAYLCEPLNYFRAHQDSVRNKTELSKADVTEHLQVFRWILDRVTVPDAVLEEICNYEAGRWVPALMSFHVPLSAKRTILRQLRALDPHPSRRLLPAAMTVIRLKIQRHWRDVRTTLTSTRTSP